MVPGRLIYVIQPLNMFVNKPFKSNFRVPYIQWMCNGDHIYTPIRKRKESLVSLILEQFVNALKAVTYDTDIKSFTKCGILRLRYYQRLYALG